LKISPTESLFLLHTKT